MIVGTVAGERGDRILDLIEQWPDLRAVIDVVGRQLHRFDLAGGGVHAQVQLAPGAALPGAVLLGQLFARAAQLEAGAVHQQVHGTGPGAGSRTRHCQGLGPAAERGVIRNRQIEAEQVEDRADQPFGLTQRQAEAGTQHQCHRDRQSRIVRLAAPRGAWRRPTACDGLLGEPDREAAAPAQGGVILGPVGYPPLRPRDMMTAPALDLCGMAKGPERPEQRRSLPCRLPPCNMLTPASSSPCASVAGCDGGGPDLA